MRKIGIILFLLGFIISCDSIPNNVVDVVNVDYSIKNIEAPEFFESTETDSLLSHELLIANSETVANVTFSLISLNGIPVVINSPMNSQTDASTGLTAYTGEVEISRQFPNGDYEIQYFVEDNVNIEDNIRKAATHKFFFFNGQENLAPIISDQLVYYIDDPDKNQLDTVLVNEEVLFTLKVMDPNGSHDIKEVGFDMEWDGNPIGSFELFDDGTHGDEVAEDGIYSRKQSFNNATIGSSFKQYYFAFDQSDKISNIITHILVVAQ